MTTYESESAEQTSELRYDMNFPANFATASEGLTNGISYHDYDWTQAQENAYNTRAMYAMHEAVDQHPGHFLGYSGVTQGEMSVMPTPYIPTAEMSFATPLGHMQYPGHENFYPQSYNTISPSSTTSNSSSGSTGVGNGQKPKRKRVQSALQRKAANVRERRRMFHLNEAFDSLRKRLPAFNYEKRLSRIETLRLAMTYIAFMKDVSDGKEPDTVQLLQIQRKSEQQYDDSQESD